MRCCQRFITDIVLKYSSIYQDEISNFNSVDLKLSKIFVDKLFKTEGQWIYTQYYPFGSQTDEFKCYFWYLKYNYITCVFKNDELVSKKIKLQRRYRYD